MANLSGADLTECNLVGANLQGCQMNQCTLDGADLRGTNLLEVKWGQYSSLVEDAGTIKTLALSADGKWLYSGSYNKFVHGWDLTTGQRRTFFKALALSADGKWLYSRSRDGAIRMWDLSTGKVLRTMGTYLRGHFACLVC
jgi:WD40 repeat protein